MQIELIAPPSTAATALPRLGLGLLAACTLEIGEDPGITWNTTRTHRGRVPAKTGSRSRSDRGGAEPYHGRP